MYYTVTMYLSYITQCAGNCDKKFITQGYYNMARDTGYGICMYKCEIKPTKLYVSKIKK